MTKRIKFAIITLLHCCLLCRLQVINALPQPNEVTTTTDPLTPAAVSTTKSAVPLNVGQDASSDDDILNSKKSHTNHEESERDKLLFYTLEQFSLLSNFTVEHGSNVFRNVLKEAATLKLPTEPLKEHLRDFSDFVARAERVEKLTANEKVGELYDMVVLFTELVERHNTAASDNTTTENLYLEMSLKKSGLDKLQVDFLERFLVFIEKLNARMDRYLENLTNEQRENEHKMIEWYRTFKEEMDSEKKVEIFAQFFELYA